MVQLHTEGVFSRLVSIGESADNHPLPDTLNPNNRADDVGISHLKRLHTCGNLLVDSDNRTILVDYYIKRHIKVEVRHIGYRVPLR